MNNYLLISDAAKEVKVDSRTLRYWEEELHLPIKRNEMGRRYYTEEDIERFKQIKSMKERGLQLKAIKMILKDGKLDILSEEEAAEMKNLTETDNIESALKEEKPHMAIEIVESREVKNSREEKAQRLQWVLQQLIKETLVENNQELCRDIKESIVKELDYQFRVQEEREEERERQKEQRNEEYYKKMDELLRIKSKRGLLRRQKNEKAEKETKNENVVRDIKEIKQGQKNIINPIENGKMQEIRKKDKNKRHLK